MIFTLFWADSGLPCVTLPHTRRYLELRKNGNKYVVSLMEKREMDYGTGYFPFESVPDFETKDYTEACQLFLIWAVKYVMGKIHEVDNTETYDYIESQHD